MEVCWTQNYLFLYIYISNALLMEFSVIVGRRTTWLHVAHSLDIFLIVAGYETRTGTNAFSDCYCLFSRRQEFRFFPFACISTVSCCSQQRFHWCVCHPLIQENRQFGSKMTDSKYFTTTKKGMIPHSCVSLVINHLQNKLHQLSNELHISFYAGICLNEISPEIFPFQKYFQEKDLLHSRS